ncbi:ASCH domain-containing protein [Pengzhenrongella sicca]|uniref:ASCH domain-containing protein n=1 Tax=Pengzhenrongella sicca TaxID=2819238 RepID=A0A8A4ZDX9_9MICO|nr:ASCH domain-containing protein [Pengzhenrongella sicca]QTE28687.1 ASCH domain-containing protein [Pengzhenrongella sicca]
MPELETDRDAAPDEAGAALVAFWELARSRVGLARLPVITGLSPAASVLPPAWAFGDSPELADELLALVLAGLKTATASAVWEYEDADEPLPRPGDLSILLDGRGHPCALVRTSAVRVVPFAEVDAESAWLEGEGDRSLDTWRREHRAAFGRALAARGRTFDESLPVVLERFELRFPARPTTAAPASE